MGVYNDPKIKCNPPAVMSAISFLKTRIKYFEKEYQPVKLTDDKLTTIFENLKSIPDIDDVVDERLKSLAPSPQKKS